MSFRSFMTIEGVTDLILAALVLGVLADRVRLSIFDFSLDVTGISSNLTSEFEMFLVVLSMIFLFGIFLTTTLVWVFNSKSGQRIFAGFVQ